jgi:glycosyltransferase involved in cell wall biosynthesis
MILLVCANFPPEPVVAACLSYDLARALSEIKEVTVLTPRPSRPCGFSFDTVSDDHDKFEHIVLKSYTCPQSKILGRMYESYSFGKHVVQYIERNWNRITAIYISAWPLIAQYLIVKASKRYAIQSIIHIQDIYPESLSNKIPLFGRVINKILLPLDRYILRHTTHIVAVSEHMRSTFISTRGIPCNKIAIVKNWQDESTFIINNDLKIKKYLSEVIDKPFTFMYLGNIGPVAGVDFLIRSFIRAKLPGASLIIAGSGSQKEKCMGIAKAHDRANIVFIDVPAGKVPEIQSNADVLLLPLRKGASMSSVPSKLPAYMLSTKPVIACVDKQSDTAYTIEAAKCGWIVPPEDTETLALTMRMVSSASKHDLMRYGKNGFNYALENLSRQNNLKKLVDIFSQFIFTQHFKHEGAFSTSR